jgi:hypothetical protein
VTRTRSRRARYMAMEVTRIVTTAMKATVRNGRGTSQACYGALRCGMRDRCVFNTKKLATLQYPLISRPTNNYLQNSVPENDARITTGHRARLLLSYHSALNTSVRTKQARPANQPGEPAMPLYGAIPGEEDEATAAAAREVSLASGVWYLAFESGVWFLVCGVLCLVSEVNAP